MASSAMVIESNSKYRYNAVPYGAVLSMLTVLKKLVPKELDYMIAKFNKERKRPGLYFNAPIEEEIPLSSALFWEHLMWSKKIASAVRLRKAENYASNCRQTAVYLIQALEMCYIYHGFSYKKINATFLYYGDEINSKFNEKRISPIQIQDFPSFPYCPYENNRLQQKLGPTPIQLSTLEWAIIWCRHHAQFDNPKVHFASIRSMMMDSTGGIQTYIYPSIPQFCSFPKDCETYIVPMLIPGTKVVHVTLAVGTISIQDDERKGILQLYDPMEDSESCSNLDAILGAFKHFKVGNSSWTIASERKIDGPVQTEHMCVVACSMFCFWKANHYYYRNRKWFENKKPTEDEWMQMRRELSQLVERTHIKFEDDYMTIPEKDPTIFYYNQTNDDLKCQFPSRF
jgi:hypothetical protein